MNVFKRGGTYWFELIYAGRRIRKSTKVKNLRTAEEIASAYRTALAKGDVGITQRKRAPAFNVAMRGFLDRSKQDHLDHPRTTQRYTTSSVALLRWFGDTPLDKITAEDIERFKARRANEFATTKGKDGHRKASKRKLRPATVNRELACLKAVFSHAIKLDLVLRNPVSRVSFLPENNEQTRVLSYQDQQRYLAAATPLLHDVATLILETGMRPEEVYKIRRENVHTAQGYLLIPNGKTKAARRRVNLSDAASEVLRQRMATGEAPWLFPCETDLTRPIPKVNNAHDRAVKISKIPPARLYDLRHTWATRAAQSGIDIVTLAAMLGHSKLVMVMRYVHPTEEHQKEAMRKLEAFGKERRIVEFANAHETAQ